MRTIVWDWNGTLLNDVSIAYGLFAELLQTQNLTVPSQDAWRALYRHPIADMYEAVGFDFKIESFDSIAQKWYARYAEESQHAPLFQGALDIVRYVYHQGYDQLIISALEDELLKMQVQGRGVHEWMNHVSGHHNLTADTKVARSLQVAELHVASHHDIIVIGDTSHDAEMADALGAECILVAHGYQDHARLKEHGYPVVNSLEEVRALLC